MWKGNITEWSAFGYYGGKTARIKEAVGAIMYPLMFIRSRDHYQTGVEEGVVFRSALVGVSEGV